MTIEIEVFSAPACGKCGQARERLRAVARDFGEDRVRWREVDVLDDMDRAVALGVLSTPAIAIDGELVFTGTPSEKALRKAVEARLKRTAP
ncbi:MAG TPA: glutaredoxin [Thiotrichales bacterium]|nr:glutaredoxin [Thiotrichales bacterium]